MLIWGMSEKTPTLESVKNKVERTLSPKRFIGFSTEIVEGLSHTIEVLRLPTQHITTINNGHPPKGIDGIGIPSEDGMDQVADLEAVTNFEEQLTKIQDIVVEAQEEFIELREIAEKRRKDYEDSHKTWQDARGLSAISAWSNCITKQGLSILAAKRATEKNDFIEANIRTFQSLYNEYQVLIPGETAMANGHTGRIFLNRLDERKTVDERLESFFITFVHEQAHRNKPEELEYRDSEGIINTYGGRENFMYAQKYMKDIAEQSLKTGVYINGYHKFLADQFKIGDLPMDIFESETFAILVEHFFKDGMGFGSRLETLSDTQKAEFDSRDDLEDSEFRHVTPPVGTTKPIGIYRVMIDLLGTDDIQTVEELFEYRRNVLHTLFKEDMEYIERQRNEKGSRKLNEAQH